MNDFRELLRILSSHQIKFILVGGVAATVHGSARLTEDLDIVYSRGNENMSQLAAALAPLSPYLRGAPPNLPFIWDAETISRGLNFTLVTTLGSLDLLGEIAGGGGYEQLLPHSVKINVFDIDCRCLALATLIEVKKAAGRPKDMETVAELEALLAKNQRK